ncbi:DNA methyltransferase [Planctomicrobium sp. SH527]|uniref:DNA methyltransferase n=1 Tax=Planctomicrobium sp. SH527 TaxID=3448123 RepID=UPI003F5BA0C3
MKEKRFCNRTSIPQNPKRNNNEHPKHVNWFPYYAGYSSSFVYDVLRSLDLKPGDTVFDPWNGSGTTTTTAYRMGANVVGFDINPVMVVAAKSTLLDLGTTPSIAPLAEEIIQSANHNNNGLVNAADPLAEWFYPQSALAFRQIHRSIWNLLVQTGMEPSCTTDSISGLSTISAFFLTALFRTTRSFVASFVGSNPTWIRSPKSHRQRIRPARRRVFERFRQEVDKMTRTLSDAMNNGLSQPLQTVAPRVVVGSSKQITADNAVADVVLTSPPYLTRIDYAVATKPELAVLGLSLNGDFDALRKAMMGAPAVRQEADESDQFGDACDILLNKVRTHPSKGSANYYYKLLRQYFSDFQCSMREIDRILKPHGTCVLVVQDSYYKELHVDLARYTTEIAHECGLTLVEQHDFKWNRNMVRVNSRSRKYRTTTDSTESVLWLVK